MNTAEKTYTLSLEDGTEARIFITPAASQGFWAHGILFDRNAVEIACQGSLLHLAMCYADGAAVVADQLLSRAGYSKHGELALAAVAAAGMECTCDD